jgi:cytosine/adenosine deaminase-related metal-dependent hydrolase
MELFLEAGFHPLEIFRSATLMGAEALGAEEELGSIQVGKLADLVVVPANPLENLKVLYGTGALQLDFESDRVERAGGILYTIKDGIVYDARELLADVREMVGEAKRGLPASPMPMFIDTDYHEGLERREAEPTARSTDRSHGSG